MKPYRPSNGTEGEIFESQWCDRCQRDAAFRDDPNTGESCPIIAAALAFDIGEPGYPPEWVEDENGPRCSGFVTAGEPKSYRCDLTLDLFSQNEHECNTYDEKTERYHGERS